MGEGLRRAVAAAKATHIQKQKATELSKQAPKPDKKENENDDN